MGNPAVFGKNRSSAYQPVSDRHRSELPAGASGRTDHSARLGPGCSAESARAARGRESNTVASLLLGDDQVMFLNALATVLAEQVIYTV